MRKAVGYYKSKIDTATKTFQALRIWVNDELESINQILLDLSKILKVEARIVFVSFHSLEDKIIKNFFRQNSQKKIAKSKYSNNQSDNDFMFELLTHKSIKPSLVEVHNNPRARSAKLRAAIFVNHQV